MKIEIIKDQYPLNPREENDNVGTMVCWHTRYTLGDEQPKQDAEDWLNSLLDEELGDIPERVEAAMDYFYSPYFIEEGYSIEKRYSYRSLGLKAEAYLQRKRDAVLDKLPILALHLYDHSGITMRACNVTGSDIYRPDGYIYVTMEKARQEWSGTDEEVYARAIAYLKAEVEEYDLYLTGEVYGFRILDDNDEELESCWGFYGEKYCEEAAQEALTSLQKAAA